MKKLIFAVFAVFLALGVVKVNSAKAEAGHYENQEFIQVSPTIWMLDSEGGALEDVQIHVAVSVIEYDREGIGVTIDGEEAVVDSVGVDSWGGIAVHISPLDEIEGFVFEPGQELELAVTHDGVVISDGVDVAVTTVYTR